VVAALPMVITDAIKQQIEELGQLAPALADSTDLQAFLASCQRADALLAGLRKEAQAACPNVFDFVGKMTVNERGEVIGEAAENAGQAKAP